MQLSALWFIEKIKALPVAERRFDALLCSTFMDLGVFKSLAHDIAGWNTEIRYLTYYHENQFQYPGYLEKSSNHQFTAINFNNAMISKGIAFNSEFNRTGFLDHVEKYLRKATDMKFSDIRATLYEKSVVLYPGLDFSLPDSTKTEVNIPEGRPPLIIWNHRWEHDKDPESFFNGLEKLKKRKISFQLAVLGQQFSQVPDCFANAARRLNDELVHIGYVADKKEYFVWLNKGDFIVSTALHEFFGIAVIEAVRVGCYPLLPARLSYPELFPEKFLYKKGDFSKKLAEVIINKETLEQDEAMNLTERFSWNSLKKQYITWLTG